jgi:hypothetical protein
LSEFSTLEWDPCFLSGCWPRVALLDPRHMVPHNMAAYFFKHYNWLWVLRGNIPLLCVIKWSTQGSEYPVTLTSLTCS